MIAYVILTHQDFPNTAELITRIYHPDNLYCICVNSGAFVEALNLLDFLRILPNVHIIPVPLTSWGFSLEAHLYGVEFCLRIDEGWQSLMIVTGSEIPVASQEKIRAELSSTYKDKIVLRGAAHAKEFDADSEIKARILKDPFHLDPSGQFDMAIYNPFTYPRPTYTRDGITLYAQPDAMRAGWSRTSSYFVKHLFHQSREQGHNATYFETISPFLRKLLKIHFKDNVTAYGPHFGILPRDFCDYCVSDKNALLHFALTRYDFGAVENFFVTLASDGEFPARRVHKCMTYVAPDPLTLEHLTDEVIETHFFARKVPPGEAGRNLCIAACDHLGIERPPEVPEFPAAPKDYGTLLCRQFQSHVHIADTVLSCGVVGERYLCDIMFGSDGLIHYSSAPPGAIGLQWCWGDGGIDVTTGGRRYARFDGLRIDDGRLLLFGYWYHAEALTLACVADVAPMLVAPAFPDLQASQYDDLTQYVWACWFSNDLVAEFVFNSDGTVWKSGTVDRFEGFWRIADGALLTFGIHSMPIAWFEQRSVDNKGRRHIAGVSWGRRLPVEPCLLINIRPRRA